MAGTKIHEKERILEDADRLSWLLKLHPELNKIKAGTYSLNGINTVEALLKLLNSGKDCRCVVFSAFFYNRHKRFQNSAVKFYQFEFAGCVTIPCFLLTTVTFSSSKIIFSGMLGGLYFLSQAQTKNTTLKSSRFFTLNSTKILLLEDYKQALLGVILIFSVCMSTNYMYSIRIPHTAMI